jgi:TonB family protein
MMSAIANSLNKPERFDLSVRKFRAICVMHGVEIGSRADLAGFMQKLMDDRHLAMDFWAFVGKLSSREGGEFSDDQVLAVVTEGVAAGEFSEEDRDTKQILDNLRAMLAGVDVQGPGQGQVEPAPFPRSETRPRYSHEGRKIHAVEPPPPEPDLRAALSSETADEGTNHKTKLPPPVQLDEALLRLELTRLVKQYFESIDKSRLESPAEGVPVASSTTRRSLEEPYPEELDELTHKPIGKSRLVLEPIGLSAEDTLMANPGRVPLEDYSPTGGYGQAVLLLVVVFALFEGGFAVYQHRAPLLKKVSASAHDIRQKTVAWMLSGRSTPPVAAPEQTASASQEEQSQQPAESQPFQGISIPPPIPSRTTTNAPAPPAPATPQAAASVDSSNNRKAMADRTVVPVEREPADDISNADLAGAVRVAPAVMDAHLIASRVPVYPETAKIDGIEGSVVIQAIISTEGTVKRVHVLQGDSHLRSAAIEAVYKRRYRPYLLNGRPVDVATTITVDFDLDR